MTSDVCGGVLMRNSPRGLAPGICVPACLPRLCRCMHAWRCRTALLIALRLTDVPMCLCASASSGAPPPPPRLPAGMVMQDGVLVAKKEKRGGFGLATFATGIVYGLQVRGSLCRWAGRPAALVCTGCRCTSLGGVVWRGCSVRCTSLCCASALACWAAPCCAAAPCIPNKQQRSPPTHSPTLPLTHSRESLSTCPAAAAALPAHPPACLQPDALFVIVPALALPTKLAAAAYILMFVLGTVAAMGAYTGLIGGWAGGRVGGWAGGWVGGC